MKTLIFQDLSYMSSNTDPWDMKCHCSPKVRDLSWKPGNKQNPGPSPSQNVSTGSADPFYGYIPGLQECNWDSYT